MPDAIGDACPLPSFRSQRSAPPSDPCFGSRSRESRPYTSSHIRRYLD